MTSVAPRAEGLDHEAIVARVLDQALAAGADAAEAYLERARRTTIRVQDGKPESLVRAGDAGIGVRVLASQRLGFFSTTRLEPEELASRVKEVVELARLATPDEHAVLPAGAGAAPAGELDLLDRALRDATAGDKIALLVRQEAAARADPRLRTDFFTYEDRVSFVHLASTRGARVTYEAGSWEIGGVVLTMASGGGSSEGGTEAIGYRAGRRLADLEEPRLGRLLAERALRTIGGRPVAAATMPVVFPPDFAAEILGAIASALAGPEVVKGDSFLARQLGERIGSDLWNVIDDGTLPGGLGSAPADAEGVPCAYHHPIVAGRLAAFLHDSYSAARMGVAPTGNALRGSFRDLPGVGPRNLILTPGHRTPEEVIAAIDRGLYVHQTVHTGGIDPVTGTYSVAAAGQLIEGGHLGRPVAHVTVASTLADMLRNLVAVAHDLEWCGSIATPTIVIEGMTVAGEAG